MHLRPVVHVLSQAINPTSLATRKNSWTTPSCRTKWHRTLTLLAVLFILMDQKHEYKYYLLEIFLVIESNFNLYRLPIFYMLVFLASEARVSCIIFSSVLTDCKTFLSHLAIRGRYTELLIFEPINFGDKVSLIPYYTAATIILFYFQKFQNFNKYFASACTHCFQTLATSVQSKTNKCYFFIVEHRQDKIWTERIKKDGKKHGSKNFQPCKIIFVCIFGVVWNMQH